jgi:tRNA G18 (ribose-2'-O)-methylase SpoU
VAEGSRTVRYLLEREWPIESLLLSEARAAVETELVALAEAAGSVVYIADQDCFDGVTGYHVHRGVLALAHRPPDRPVDDVLDQAGGLVLVIEGVNDHENLGSLFRNAAALGAGAVLLDATAADPLYRRSIRVSLGQVLAVPFARDREWPAALDRMRERGWRIVALTPQGDETLAASRVAGVEQVAVLVGSEGAGLTAAALERADQRVRIPMAGGIDSVNVATAAAIALFVLGAGPQSRA